MSQNLFNTLLFDVNKNVKRVCNKYKQVFSKKVGLYNK